jgi:hypothetical protein
MGGARVTTGPAGCSRSQVGVSRGADRVSRSGKLFATIPPKWQGFGPITLHDDETKMIIGFGSFTHDHIVGTAEEITAEIVQVLRDGFAERVVFWTLPNGGLVGWT